MLPGLLVLLGKGANDFHLTVSGNISV